MTAYNFGDVILVPFPFTDQSQAKQRPAVIVSSARYNAERPDLILMAITSQVRSPDAFGEVIGQRRLQQIASLPPDERRQIMQLVDAFIERGQLKRRSSQAASG